MECSQVIQKLQEKMHELSSGCFIDCATQAYIEELLTAASNAAELYINYVAQERSPVVHVDINTLFDILDCLNERSLFSKSRIALYQAALISARFYDPSDSWSSHHLAFKAASTMQKIKSGLSSKHVYIDLIDQVIRARFSIDSTNTVTPQGSICINKTIRAPENTYLDESKLHSLWHNQFPDTVTIIRCIIDNIDDDSLRQNWRGFIPPMVIFLEAGNKVYRIKGCEILYTFLEKIDINLLNAMALDTLFFSLLKANLAFLPPITEPADSIVIIDATAKTFLKLAKRLASNGKVDESIWNLNTILYDSFLLSATYASSFPTVMRCFIIHIEEILQLTGIESIPFLSLLLELLSDILVHPLAPNYIELSIEAARCLMTIISIYWPRIATHSRTILKAVIICSNMASQETNEKSYNLRHMLKQIMQGLLILDGQNVGEDLKQLQLDGVDIEMTILSAIGCQN